MQCLEVSRSKEVRDAHTLQGKRLLWRYGRKAPTTLLIENHPDRSWWQTRKDPAVFNASERSTPHWGSLSWNDEGLPLVLGQAQAKLVVTVIAHQHLPLSQVPFVDVSAGEAKNACIAYCIALVSLNFPSAFAQL